MPIPGHVVDFYDDSDRRYLKKMAQDLGPWRSAEVLSPGQVNDLLDEDFALVVITKTAGKIRKFPLHDEAHIKLASMYFEEANENLSAAERVCAATHIREACDAYEIEADPAISKYAANGFFSNIVEEGVRNEYEKYAELEMTKEASRDISARMEVPDDQYALLLDNEGETIRKYGMPDESHVKIAASYFKKYARDLSPEHRHMFAENVIRRAGELNVDLDTSYLQKWASGGWNQGLSYHLNERRTLLDGSNEALGVLDKLAELAESTDPDTFASALYEFDKQAGLDGQYGKHITDPWESSMAPQKTAMWNEDVDGETITGDDLKSAANSDKLRSHFGEAFQNQFKAHAIEIFNSLPDPDKVVVKQIAKGQI